jgi:hypothetical protein
MFAVLFSRPSAPFRDSTLTFLKAERMRIELPLTASDLMKSRLELSSPIVAVSGIRAVVLDRPFPS